MLPTAVYPSPSTYRLIIDPKNTLPDVCLREVVFDEEDETGANSKVYDIVSRNRNRNIGRAYITYNPDENVTNFSSIERYPDRDSRKGVGLATYLLAIEEASRLGAEFRPDEILSEKGHKMWQRLIGYGVAECIDEFSYDEERPYPYSGKARVLSPQELHAQIGVNV